MIHGDSKKSIKIIGEIINEIRKTNNKRKEFEKSQ